MTETTGVKGKGLAIAGMVVGIVAFLLSFIIIGWYLGVVGLILSVIGFVQLNGSNGPKGMAITGIILNVLAIALGLYLGYKAAQLLEEGGNEFLDKFKQEMEKMDTDDLLENLED